MSSVMIRCPTTGLAVSTEIETEPSVFRKLPKVAARMRCSACGQEHIWMTSSAWLAGDLRALERMPPTEAA
jgi:cytochrome c-type biogenesis protein CcmH/NrfF